MANLEQPPTKRMRTETARHDLNIIIEGETVSVHSQVLAIVSPVFLGMLNSGMIESQKQEISLPGKKKEEFVVFMEIIQPMSRVQVTTENCYFLARWADEYAVEVLKEKCEDMLMSQSVTLAMLQHAVECNLHRCAEKCYATMCEDIHPYMPDLASLGSAFPQDMLQRLWPAISEAAGLGEMPVPGVKELETLLPVLVICQTMKAQLAAKDKKLKAVLDAVQSWPGGIYELFYFSDFKRVDEKARTWLRERVNSLGSLG
mmetsp:Transcript_9232/g.16626  ORF Transcript_9232/g.16626 Transcript_9232/m.16626 type:complete len:259 (+) Transcript_9232:64-840(+)